MYFAMRLVLLAIFQHAYILPNCPRSTWAFANPTLGLDSLRQICADPSIHTITLPLLSRFYGPSNYPSLFPFPGCTAPNARQAAYAPGLLDCSVLGIEVQNCQSRGKKVLLSVKADGLGAVGGNAAFGDPASAKEPFGLAFAATKGSAKRQDLKLSVPNINIPVIQLGHGPVVATKPDTKDPVLVVGKPGTKDPAIVVNQLGSKDPLIVVDLSIPGIKFGNGPVVVSKAGTKVSVAVSATSKTNSVVVSASSKAGSAAVSTTSKTNTAAVSATSKTGSAAVSTTSTADSAAVSTTSDTDSAAVSTTSDVDSAAVSTTSTADSAAVSTTSETGSAAVSTTSDADSTFVVRPHIAMPSLNIPEVHMGHGPVVVNKTETSDSVAVNTTIKTDPVVVVEPHPIMPSPQVVPVALSSPSSSIPQFPNLFDGSHTPSAFALTLFSLFGEGHTERADLRPLGPDAPSGASPEALNGTDWINPILTALQRPLGEEVVVDGFDIQLPAEWKGTYQDRRFQTLVSSLKGLHDEAWIESGGVNGGPADLGADGKGVVYFGWVGGVLKVRSKSLVVRADTKRKGWKEWNGEL